ncbi:MAG TPA: type IV pilus assembly protein PilM [Phycisphaerae bacterium]|nr:type IV pilus assembly protein PilM [Phycisphaerae bacterium]
MASRQPIWGIDVGQVSLKAIKLQAAGDKVEMLGFDHIEHSQILSQAETDATEIAKKSIATFASRNELSGSKIVVSVPGQQTLTRFTKMPPVEAKKIPDMVQYEASQQIPFDMDEVVWDYQVFTEKEGVEVEVGIFAIRKELIRNYLSMFTSQGVEPFMVQTGPMASYNVARFELSQPENETYVLLEMGAIATDLIVMEGNRIWSRTVQIGGNRFTEALVSAFKIPFAKAEKLKRSAATSKYARQIFQAMRPVFADLVSEVQRSIGYYTSTHREAHITRIIGMGNAFKLPGLQKFLQQNVQMKVDKFPGFTRLVEVNNPKKAEFEENFLSLGVCYGLALQGLELAAVTSNLLPMEIRKTLLWQKKQPWFVASAACLALAAGSIWIGNVMASGEIQEGLGGAEAGPPPRVASVNDAMSILSSPGAATPVQRAQQVTAAAKFLKTEYGKYTSGSKDAGTLGELAKFPENNKYVPIILDVIHRAYAEATSPDLKSVKTPQEYKRVADRIEREKRDEVWIDKLAMDYHTDPGTLLVKVEGEVVKRGRPGWAIRITGITTKENAPTWIEENLSRPLLELGCKPGTGIYFDVVSLGKIRPREKTVRTADGDLGLGGGTEGGGDGGRRGGGQAQRRGGRSPEMQPPRRGGRAGPGTDVSRGPTARRGTGGLADLEEELRNKDPLTKESISQDFMFDLDIIVRKEEVPKDRIPERYKEKTEEPAKPGTPVRKP